MRKAAIPTDEYVIPKEASGLPGNLIISKSNGYFENNILFFKAECDESPVPFKTFLHEWRDCQSMETEMMEGFKTNMNDLELFLVKRDLSKYEELFRNFLNAEYVMDYLQFQHDQTVRKIKNYLADIKDDALAYSHNMKWRLYGKSYDDLSFIGHSEWKYDEGIKRYRVIVGALKNGWEKYDMSDFPLRWICLIPSLRQERMDENEQRSCISKIYEQRVEKLIKKGMPVNPARSQMHNSSAVRHPKPLNMKFMQRGKND